MANKYRINGHTGEIMNYDEKPKDLGFFFDDAEALLYASRKADRHATKGKRRIKGGYKGDRYV